jgi:uncharacterized glyoxalase superfamily protein PhnB
MNPAYWLPRHGGRSTNAARTVVVPDVDAACGRAVSAGARLLQAPERKPWGQTVAFVRTPGGALVQLCTPRDDPHTERPP